MGLTRARTVAALGVIQIVAWGSTFYLPAVLSAPIVADTGWAYGTVTGGLSVALLASGLAARKVGRLIGAFGGRPVLAGGILLLAAGLVLLGLARSVPVYFGAWALLGVAMAATLYDAAFSTLGRIYGAQARPAITMLTLWAGFASTICWPLTALVTDAFGWRGACFFYAALHLALTLPLCLFAVPSVPRTSPIQGHATTPDAATDLRFWCLAVAGSALAMIVSAVSVHLVPILMERGLTLAAAVSLGALIGPAQVGARALEFMGRGRHHPVWTMIVACVLIAAGLAALRCGVPAAAAVVAYGAGAGLWSIARGTLPLALFGPLDYAPMVGRIAAPILIASATAPLLGAALMQRLGPDATLAALAACAAVPLCAALVLAARIWQD